MSDQQASRTALGVAYMRAAHQLLEAPPRILEDPVALPLLGPDAPGHIQSASDRYHASGALALRAHVVLRSRFAEDRLAAALARGVTQYIILGAGFDTFALRQPDWARALRVIEVDHPGTQNRKRALIEAAGLALPENAGFATIDFEHESLAEGLRRYAVSLETPTFFSWLGVTMYLKEESIDAVLRSVAAFPRGSEIVLTYASPREEGVSPLARRAADLGEPWLSYFEPGALDAKLRGAGFSQVEFLTPAVAEAHYFANRPPDLPVPKRTNIVTAIL